MEHFSHFFCSFVFFALYQKFKKKCNGRLDPENAQALDGLHGVERNSTAGELDLSGIAGREPRDGSSMEVFLFNMN